MCIHQNTHNGEQRDAIVVTYTYAMTSEHGGSLHAFGEPLHAIIRRARRATEHEVGRGGHTDAAHTGPCDCPHCRDGPMTHSAPARARPSTPPHSKPRARAVGRTPSRRRCVSFAPRRPIPHRPLWKEQWRSATTPNKMHALLPRPNRFGRRAPTVTRPSTKQQASHELAKHPLPGAASAARSQPTTVGKARMRPLSR